MFEKTFEKGDSYRLLELFGKPDMHCWTILSRRWQGLNYAFCSGLSLVQA